MRFLPPREGDGMLWIEGFPIGATSSPEGIVADRSFKQIASYGWDVRSSVE